MKKHLMILVNNERTNVRIASRKGYDRCINNGKDWCPSYATDLGICINYAYDYCSKEDYAACTDGADDRCTIDTTVCRGQGVLDFT